LVTLTATVSGGSGTPTGSVTFKDGANSLGAGTVVSGTAILHISSLAIGGHTITAVYGGDATFGASSSLGVSQTVNQGATTSVLVASPNPSGGGLSVTFTATVAAVSPAAGTPTGTVNFLDGATSLGPGTLAGGTAMLSTSGLAIGAHSITAVYGGDANFTGSTSSPLTQTVLAIRTWVSGVGNDSNDCSRTAPCLTFAGAIANTAAGGEIDCLDPGGFGTVTITKAITLDCASGSGRQVGSILASGSDGIVITGMPAGSSVTIRNLSINGVVGTGAPGLNGIRYISGGGALHIENVRIFGFSQKGVDFENAAAANLFIRSSQISDNVSGGGIFVKPSGGVLANVSLENVRMDRNLFGLRVEDGGKVTVKDSVAHANANNGFLAVSSAVAAEINLVRSIASNTLANGIATSGPLATIRLFNSAITDNGTGINTSGGGTVIGTSPDTNLNFGNATPGAPTTNVALQ
jgi:hypothetical protein